MPKKRSVYIEPAVEEGKSEGGREEGMRGWRASSEREIAGLAGSTVISSAGFFFRGLGRGRFAGGAAESGAGIGLKPAA